MSIMIDKIKIQSYLLNIGSEEINTRYKIESIRIYVYILKIVISGINQLSNAYRLTRNLWD